MRLLVAQQPLRRMLRWTERLLFAAGLALLAWCAYVVLDARVFQQAEDRRLDGLLSVGQETSRGAPQTPSLTAPPAPLSPAPAGLIGRLDIPRLGLSVIVIEGVRASTLRRAVGHIPGTALPGNPGNVGISGHRDTFFRPLRNIRSNDVVTLTTLLGELRYRVVSTSIVRPDNIAVLRPTENQMLTLVTCYPFYFVGPAPSRFIVRAERVADNSSASPVSAGKTAPDP
jgi:sortase A